MNLKSQRMALVIGALLIFLFAGGNWFTQISHQDTSLAKCYYQQIGTTDSLLQIDSQDGNKVLGSLVIHNAEKDSSYGTFSGKLKDSELNISFNFWSEGILSTREITYELVDKKLKGEGFEYQPRTDCREILYPQGLSLIPYKVQLPLHLFSKLATTYPQQDELLQIFGNKRLLPQDSITLLYRPAKGEPLKLANIYYWDQTTWTEVSAQAGAPGWGQLVASKDGRVLSVSTVQDCVYEDKSECSNVTEIYQLLTDKNSYI